ncbi:MAG: radical SAM protein [Desulfobacterales bacterium]|nr:radical SAM protein [Desulfobacterales bacterium]
MFEVIRPSIIAIDPITFCQLRCPGCPNTGRGTAPLMGHGRLTFQKFKELIDINPNIQTIEFDCFGELFLNKELLLMIEYAFNKGICSTLSTSNFNYVRPDVLEGLVKYGVRSLGCAIDGATPETYKIYRKRGNFDQVMANIKELVRLKKLYNSQYPKLTWQFVVFGHNEHEIPLVKSLSAELGMKISFKMAWNTNYAPIRNKKFVMDQLGWLSTNREDYESVTNQPYMNSVCLQLWRAPRINWDGKVLGCCWTQTGFNANVFTDGYLNAINNPQIKYARKMLMGKSKPRDDIQCSRCHIYKLKLKTGKFLTTKELLSVQNPSWFRLARNFYQKSGLRKILNFRSLK